MPNHTRNMFLGATIASVCLIQNVVAFAPNSYSVVSSSTRSSTAVHAYIASDSVDDDFDPNAGGIGLAMENAICISGSVDKKGGAIAKEMNRYTKVVKMSDVGATVICKGDGAEIYQDPGLSTEKSISLAPISAVQSALGAIENDVKDGQIYINFAGGDDLLVHEVLEGVQQMVSGLNLTTSKVTFRSMCEPSFAMDKCGVAVISVDESSSSPEGQIYYYEGSWYTLSEDDINTAIE